MKSLSSPRVVFVTARIAVGLVLFQFILAGTSLYVAPFFWGLHGAIGGTIAIPIVALLYQTRRNTSASPLRGSCWWLLVLYCVQVALAIISGQPEMMALRVAHVSNAALAISVSFHIVMRAKDFLIGSRVGVHSAERG